MYHHLCCLMRGRGGFSNLSRGQGRAYEHSEPRYGDSLGVGG